MYYWYMAMMLRKLLSHLFRYDFTAIPGDEIDESLTVSQLVAPVRPRGACGAWPKSATFQCCDCTYSSVKNKRVACIGHYGVCR